MGAAISQPYVQAALIAAIPATLTAFAAWYSAHKNGKQEHADNDKISEKLTQIDTRFERIETHFERMDLRFDTIEDKVERHLGWHRNEAEVHLQDLLKKETQNGRHSQPND